MTVIHDMIDMLASDRDRWTPDRDNLARTWEQSFRSVHSDVLREACEGFLKNQAGNPNLQKLWEEIRRIQPDPCITGRVLTHTNYTEPEGTHELVMEKIRADLEVKGDPIRDWLEARGL